MQNLNIEKVNQLTQITNRINAFYHKVATSAGLSDGAFWILYMVKTLASGCRQKDISEASGKSKKTINSAIWKLEQEGLLRLELSNGRDKNIFLTEKGEAFVEKTITPVIIAEAEAFNVLTENEQTELIRITEKYYDDIINRFL